MGMSPYPKWACLLLAIPSSNQQTGLMKQKQRINRMPSMESIGPHAANQSPGSGCGLSHLLRVTVPSWGFAPMPSYFAFTNSMIFLAPSSMLLAFRMFRPDSARIFRPSSTLVPSIRTTRGTVKGFSRMASTIPLA